ncbi:MAG: CD1375 family protein [Paenibacillus sp.]|nr:CD1375 family protein [Paenibacillus sp.]MDU4698386.1 CD1375 family protein [Paenibacillus sp.]
MENSIMVDVYVQLIKAGRKTIERVPEYGGLRDAVIRQMEQGVVTEVEG